MKRFLALLLAFVLLVTPALASQALGWELVTQETSLGPGVTHTTRSFWGDSRSDYRREQYVTYTPGQGPYPVVLYGATLNNRATLTAMAKSLEENGQRVLAGANGDYFVMASGVPLGLVVTWGTLRSSSSYHYGVGVRSDGSMFVGKPDLGVWVDFHGYHLSVTGGFNKSASDAQGGYTLYSSDYGPSTSSFDQGLHLLLRPVEVPEDYQVPQAEAVEWEPLLDPETGEELPEEDQEAGRQAAQQAAQDALLARSAWDLATLPATLTIGGELTCVVERVMETSGKLDIPEGRFVLSMDANGSAFHLDELKKLKVGEQLKLSVTTSDPRWTEAVHAIGAYSWIVQNGQVASGLEKVPGPRTALGVKADGSVILYTLDGRRPGHSVGGSVEQVAARLVELGCTDAVLFDGGGSTTFGTTAALDQTFSLQNKPSEGVQRPVTNALFFVSDLKPTGELGSLYLQPEQGLLLSGATLSLSARGVDTGGYPLGEEPVGGVTYTVEGPGSVTGSLFTAGAEKGTAVVTGAAPGGQRGTTRFTVVDTPHTITVSTQGQPITSLNLDPDQSVDLSAAAEWYKLPLAASDDCFTWQVTPEVGTVDAQGVLTAGSKAAAGTVDVTAGDKTVRLTVSVAGHITLLSDCEGETPMFLSDTAAWTPVSDVVRYGEQSLRLDYPLDVPSSARCALPIAPGETHLSLWVYGDGSSTALCADVLTTDGETVSLPLTPAEPFTGWRQLMTALPDNALSLEGFTVTPGEGATGTLYLDHFLTANGPLTDATAPTAELTVDNGLVSATLADNVDKTFDARRLALTLDGRPLDFTLEGSRLTARFDTADGLLHRVSLTVSDVSGNLTRVSGQTQPQGGRASPFADTAGHWAEPYINYMYDHQVTNGREQDGVLVFDPDTQITRAEFATMLWRWLGRDSGAYDGVELPFVDAGDIPAWALGPVKGLYAMGIFTGSLEGDGLHAMARDTLTRSQAMTMLGRVQPKGYPSAEPDFADAGDIPTWALEHVCSLVGQGVVGGYEGYVRPLDPINRSEVAKLLTTLW